MHLWISKSVVRIVVFIWAFNIYFVFFIDVLAAIYTCSKTCQTDMRDKMLVLREVPHNEDVNYFFTAASPSHSNSTGVEMANLKRTLIIIAIFMTSQTFIYSEKTNQSIY